MAAFVRFRFPPATNAPGDASKTSAALDRPTGLSVVDGARQWYGNGARKIGYETWAKRSLPLWQRKKIQKMLPWQSGAEPRHQSGCRAKIQVSGALILYPSRPGRGLEAWRHD